MPTDASLLVFEELEHALTEHAVFGSSEYIRDQVAGSLQTALAEMGASMPAAGELAAALRRSPNRRIVDDMVLRSAVMRVASYLGEREVEDLGWEECGAIFSTVADYLNGGGEGSPIQDGTLSSLGPHGSLIWSDRHADDLYGRAFRKLVSHNYDAVPCTPTAAEHEALVSAAELLVRLLPALGPSALSHATVVAYVPPEGKWRTTSSSSQIRLSGTIFLARHLQNRWALAEHLLHEALHQKLYSLQVCHSVLDTRGKERAHIRTPWNPRRMGTSNRWDVHRTLAAFHVYVHLALLALVSESSPPELFDRYGPSQMIGSTTALERAHFLGRQLRTVCWDNLGMAGQELVSWLSRILAILDPDPPPETGDLHLRLDLYTKETAGLQEWLGLDRTAPDSELAARFAAAAELEARGARELLRSAGAAALADSLDDALARVDRSRPVLTLIHTRMLIMETLRAAAGSRYAFSDSETLNDSLNDMLETASDRLYAIQENHEGPGLDLGPAADRRRRRPRVARPHGASRTA